MEIYKGFEKMSAQYLLGAQILWKQIDNNPNLFNPIVFLLRHSIELSIKGRILRCEQIYDNSLKISDIKIDNRGLDTIHSTKKLWSYLYNIAPFYSAKEYEIITKGVEMLDKMDFDSTKYRYPISRSGKKASIEPIALTSEVCPNLSKSIPKLIISNEKNHVIAKGVAKIENTTLLFKVANLLSRKY